MILIDRNLASGLALLTMTSELWRTLTTNSPSHIKTWRTFPLPFCMTAIATAFYSFNAFGRPSKGQIFVMDTLGWIPMCFTTWISKADRRHVMARLRENRAYVHEVAAKLVEEKRQEVKDGTSQRNVLTLFGSSCVPFNREARQAVQL